MSQCYCEDCQKIDYCHSSQIDWLQSENDRLRTALEKIIYKCYLCDKGFESFPCSCGKYGTTEEIVRDALEGEL
jgi:hypothetical protein